MSKTRDELCRLLDERGVSYTHIGRCVSWMPSTKSVYVATYDEIHEDVFTILTVFDATPEQAIAVMLSETCCIRGGECDQCGAYIHKQANTYWVPTGEGLRTVECHDVHYCPNCGRRVVEE